MDQLHLLFLLSFSMLIGSFFSGTVPMAFKLSDAKSRLLALMGSGILVGTALAIIIPEGIDAIYAQPRLDNDLNLSSGASATSHHKDTSIQDQINRPVPVQTWTIGISLITGFVLMLFIDQFSIYQNDNNDANSLHHHHHHHQQHNYSLANQEEDEDEETIDVDNTEISNTRTLADNDETSSETKPINANDDTHRISMRSADTNHLVRSTSSNDVRPQFVKARKPKVTPTLGLVIHAAADGIALGAAATTSHRDTEMIIFLAIMLHKAPAAFSLVVFLLHRGLKHSTIRRHLLAFSLSAPLAALLTFFGLSQSGKEALRRNNATGIAMLFSAGTFLYVATVHVLPELVNNILLTPKEMLFLVGGAFLPLLLAQTI